MAQAIDPMRAGMEHRQMTAGKDRQHPRALFMGVKSTNEKLGLGPDVCFCHGCEEVKSVAEFYPSDKKRCKGCARAKYERNRESLLRYKAEWRAKNPDHAKEWYRKNAEQKRAYNKRHYAENREANRARRDEWARVNPGKVNALIAARRGRILRQTPPWADLKSIERFYQDAARLTRETGEQHDVDHIHPLKGKNFSGLHVEYNLQVLPHAENLRKKNRLLPE